MAALHTVIGSTGATGKALVRLLQEKHPELAIRTVSRSASTSSSHVSASCLDRDAIVKACEGSAVVYLIVGIEYSRSVWKRDWPVIIANVLEACSQAGAVLVHADNLYMYGAVDGPLSTSLPYTTSSASVKSLVRADVARTVEASSVRYAMVRASDFYGADITTLSHFGDYVVPALLKGRTAKFIVEPDRWKHSLTPPADFARALMIAGTDPRAWGRAWHVPCAPARTLAEYAALIAEIVHETGGPPPAPRVAARLMPALVQWLLTPAVTFFGEIRDMKHVWDRDYVVDATPFLETFGAEFNEPLDPRAVFTALVEEYRRREAEAAAAGKK